MHPEENTWRNFKRGDTMRVSWIDIISESAWKKPDDLEEPPVIKTVGYFIGVKTYHMHECLIIAGSFGMDGEISNADIIPTGCIISIESLDGS